MKCANYLWAVAIAVVMINGCGWFESSSDSAGGKKTVSVTFNQAEFERDRNDYRRRAELRMQDLDARMKALHEQAQVATGDAKRNLDEAVAAQQANLEKARGEMKEIEAAGADKWADVKARSSAALDDLQKGFENAFSRFK